MRVMIINGSPRRRGYTSDLIELFQAGVRAAGGEPHAVALRELKITPCIGCYKCWVGETTGRCIFSDDMDGVLEQYLNADALVLATPLYYYSFSYLIKVFLERLLPTTRPGFETGGTLGLGRSRPRHPGRGPKRCVLIASCGFRNLKTLAPLTGTFDLVCDAMAALPVGKLLRPESFLMDFDVARPKTLRRIFAAFERAGRELVETGCVSGETETEACLPLTVDDAIFAKHFETYWTVAHEMGPGWVNRKELSAQVTRDPRILVLELASYLHPANAGDLTAVIQLILKGRMLGDWYLRIENGHCEATSGVHASPDLTLKMAEETFTDIALQRMDARTALNRGLVEAAGSRRLLFNFGRLFKMPDH